MDYSSLDKNAVKREVDKILNSITKNKVEIKIQLHTPNDTIDVDHLLTYEILKDYNSNISDYIIINFLLPKGTALKRVIPFKSDIEVSISIKAETWTDKMRYKLFILNGDENVDTKESKMLDEKTLDKQDMLKIEAQCVDFGVLSLRQTTTSGIFRNTNVENLIKHTIVDTAKNVKVNGKPMDLKIDMVKPDNQYVYEHIIITNEIRLTNLPTFLQNSNYGVYNGDIGTYLKPLSTTEFMLFIYPLYNVSRIDTAKKKLIVIHSTSNNLTYVEHTYRKEADAVIVLANNVKSKTTGDVELINNSYGFKTIDSTKVMKRPVGVAEKAVVVDKTKTSKDTIMKKNKANLNMSKKVKPSMNLYKNRSAYLHTHTDKLMFQWSYSNPDLIFPGMPLRFIEATEKNGVRTRRGIVQSIFTKINVKDGIPISMVNINVEKDEE